MVLLVGKEAMPLNDTAKMRRIGMAKRSGKATPEQLQYWATRVLTAKKLPEVFRG